MNKETIIIIAAVAASAVLVSGICYLWKKKDNKELPPAQATPEAPAA